VSAPGDLQAVVDTLAARLQLSVLVEDSEYYALHWSDQIEIDDVRLHAILRRGIHPAAEALVRRLALADAIGPVRTPAIAEAGMHERWCVPLRAERRLLGYLWVVDPDGRVDEAGLQALTASAEKAASLLLDRPIDVERRRVDDLIARLEKRADQQAAQALIALLRLPADVVIVVDAGQRTGGWAVTGGLSAFTADRAHESATSGRPLPLVDLAEAVRRATTTLQAIAAGAQLTQPTWDHLGAWRLIVDAPRSVTPDDLHPGAELLRALPKPDLLLTAQTFLRLGGDIAAVTAALHVHRTTLYYRLDRIAAITGTDLRSHASAHDLDLALRLAAFRAVLDLSNVATSVATRR
jgi:hypothetical protein